MSLPRSLLGSLLRNPMFFSDLIQTVFGYLHPRQQEKIFASAVLSGCRSKVAIMLSTGVKFDRGTVIKAAIQSDSCAMIDFLIDHGLTLKSDTLYVCCKFGSPKMLRYLLEIGSNKLEPRCLYNYVQIKRVDTEMLSVLLEFIPINRRSYSNFNVLMLLLLENKLIDEEAMLEIVQLLIERGIDLFAFDSSGRFALEMAIDNKRFLVAELILQQVATEPFQTKTADILDNALHESAYGGHDAVSAKVLDVMKEHPEMDYESSLKRGLRLSLKYRDIKSVSFFIERGADINDVGDGEGSLHVAAERGDMDLFHYLIEQGADLFMKDNKGKTVLDVAISVNNKPLIEFLISKGVEFLPKSVHSPVRNLNLDVLKILLDAGGDIKYVDPISGISVLHEAARAITHKKTGDNPKRIAILNFIFRRFPEGVNLPDKNGKTPLHYVVEYPLFDQEETIEFMVKKMRADINVRDKGGHTPLQRVIVRSISLNEPYLRILGAKGSYYDVVHIYRMRHLYE